MGALERAEGHRTATREISAVGGSDGTWAVSAFAALRCRVGLAPLLGGLGGAMQC